MAKQIWKFSVGLTDKEQKIIIPKGAAFLTIQMQQGVAQIWAIVDPEEERQEKTIRVYGTGEPLQAEERQYIGTVQIWNTVYHIFEIIKL